MADSFPSPLNKRIEERLRYYEDLGIRLFYRDRAGSLDTAVRLETAPEVEPPSTIDEIAPPKPVAAVPSLAVPSPVLEMKQPAAPFPTLQEELSAKFASDTSLFAGPKDASLQ